MFGLGKNDKLQLTAVEKFKKSLAPLRGGYVCRIRRGEDPVLLTEVQRDAIVGYYADLLNRSMFWALGLTMAGLLAGAAVDARFNIEPHFWSVMIVVVMAIAPSLTIWPRLRQRIEQFGPLPTASSHEVQALAQKRLKRAPWAAILTPGAGLPFLAWQLHPHMPPRDADDWTEYAFLLAIGGVFVWAVVKKLRADGSLSV